MIPVRSLLVILLTVLLGSCDVEFDAGNPNPPITPGSTVVPLLEWDNTMATTLNIVFVPDTSYGDLTVQANLQRFYDDIEEVIEEGYWQNNAYWVNFPRFNYYYMTVAGSAAAPTTGICPTVTWPAQVATDAAFANLVLLLHPNPLRDCRWGNRATTEPTSFRTVVHESSHALFNLPDEYCCDGGYRVLAPVMYNSSNSCNADAANAAWRNCTSFVATSGTGATWWRSEDGTTDIMSGSGDIVLEAGQADWAVMSGVFAGLGRPATTPSVFAPAAWNRP
jgi:hypothetical protein